ncbi:MAG: type II toxin-antitoxin system VapC family toxin [Actinobacteria bacterium]|nr:type II toxin-antitoxin system VapC family toxin [Actinomycetota bacterium]
MTLVVDASVVTSALIDAGPDGTWAEDLLANDHVIAPHLMPAEVANILRRAALAGDVSVDVASLALADLLDLRIELFPFRPLAPRVWELRNTVTAYDAWYVALAESYDVPCATLDTRLAAAPGPLCTFRTTTS